MSRTTEPPWGEIDGVAHVVVGRCTTCEHTFFPPQELGCERCGAAGDCLVRETALAVGTVRTRVAVHIHPSLSTPFDVAEVALDGIGVMVQATVAGDTRGNSSVIGQIIERDGVKTFGFIPMREDS